ncbi:intein N-terminal splicing region/RHS repeat-associated core domain-containing protein [Lentzea xinjiangensis]|uniref:Intein N-terminal splicing region/RHS repeat-associated core domain-containing protein n=1 Tax=Lentzea xinjiangensis TaxID=402600 RepID=A0A1H9PWV0_9PSEU|nr:polymorphic toxin-type HINT domain-containing protein [Lentzea xinjiangensis]SER52083.1 intein N-terminal splicing region/RHS repeat-associated core domain-containing protein [Lentzea xinjiangensis]
MALVGGIVGPSSGAVLEGWFAQREAQRQLEEAMAGTPQQDWTTAGKAAARLKHRDHVVEDGVANTAEARSEQAKYPPISRTGPWSQPSSTTKVLDSPQPQVKGFDQKTSQELPERREEHRSTYRNADGTDTTVYSQSRVNFRDADGKWQRVDTGLKQDGTGWRNAADAVTTRLAGRADASQLVTLELDRDHSMSYRLRDAAPVAGRADGSAVTYPGVRAESDLRITATPGGFKEDLVLHSASAPTTWFFPLQLKGLSAKVVDNAVVLTDGTGAERAVIPAGFMTDSNVDANTGDPATSYGVRYEIVDGTTLKVELDRAWLADGARKFPVTVDPSVLERKAATSMYVQRTGSSSFSRSDGLELKVGRASGGINATTYLAFPGIENDLRNHRIFGAQLFLLNYYSWSCRPAPMSVHPVTQGWTAGAGHTYPGPAVGDAVASSSFAQGYIPSGANSSACPATGQAINLGDAGRDLVQRWVNHSQANFGLSLRASETDVFGWKKIAGHNSAVPPTLYVTHSPYNATYHIENGVPAPPVTRNQDGVIKVKVTNLGRDTWRPGEYFLAYRRFDARGGYQAETESAQLPHDVPRGQSVTLDAKIGRVEPGQYSLEFTMVHKGVKVFTDEQVPPARLGLQVFDVPPIVTGQYPPNGHSATSLAQQLWVNATDVDAPGGSQLKYRFEVCEADRENKPVAGSCFDSGRVDRPTWTIPAGKIRWSKTYLWRAFAFDGSSESEALPFSALLTNVPQPEVTSQIGAAPYSGGDRDFNPVNGNYTSAAIDASLATVGPDLTLARTYNSLDPRRDLAFGSGWVSRLDMRVVEDTDGSGNVVVTYPDGQTVRFGAHRNTDGTFDRTYAPPPGRFATFFLETIDGSQTYVLVDKAANHYKFRKLDGRLIEIHDAHRRGVKLTYGLPDVGPTRITSTVSNRQLRLEWGTNKHVKRAFIQESESKVLEWKYTYDTTDPHKLISVCNPKSECTTYDYEQGSHYRSVVLDSRPKHYWRLGETTGDSARSEILTNLGKDAAKFKDVQLGKASPLDGNQNPAAGFNGTSSVVELPRDAVRLSRDVAVEMWFRTTGNGPLLGYQNKAVGEDATSGVPMLYVGTDGKLRGQFWNGRVAPLTSAAAVNDGNWHHVVLTGAVSKQQLFVDGVQQGGDLDGDIDHANLSFAQAGAAYAPVEGDWPGYGAGKRRFFTGEVDEVAVYEHSLGLPAVKAHIAEKAQAPHLTKITLPSGRTASTIAYDHGNDRVREVVDADGGKWKIEQPVMTGSEDNLIRTVGVTDPGERPHSYDYDAKRSRILRYTSPIGMSTRPEDRLPQPAAPTTNPNCQPASGVEDGAPVFCVGKGGTTPPQIVDSTGKTRGVRSYDYDASGFQSTITDELGNQVKMVNDERGNVKQTTTCRRSGTDCSTSYVEHFLNPADFTDPRNDKVIGERDARSSGPADDRYLDRSEYDVHGNLVTGTAAGGQVVTHRYSTDSSDQAADGGNVPAGLVMSTQQTGSGTTLYSYFRNGDLESETSPTGLKTSYKYDSLGRKTEETESSPSTPPVTTKYTYDDLSRVVATTDPAITNTVSGVVHTRETRSTFDADGNRTKLEAVDLTGGDAPRVATFGYDDRGRLAEEVDAEGNKTSHGYDHFGNKMWTVSPGGVRTDFTYTARNKIAEVWLRGYTGDPVDPTRPNEGQNDQDDVDAPTKPGKDSLLVHSYLYDLAGRLHADVDAMGRTTKYAYYRDNSLRAIVAVGAGRDADGNRRDITVQDNAYDPAGHLVRQVVAGGLVTEYEVDEAGRTRKTVQDPGGLARTTELTYDAAGQVKRVVKTGNPSNFPATSSVTEVVDFEYDAMGRQTKEIVHRGAADPLVTERTYDAYDRVRTEVDPRGVADPARRAEYTNSYTYDAKGQLVQLTGPLVKAEENGAPAQDARARITSGYNTFGQVTHHRDAKNDVTETTFDKLGRQVAKKSPGYTPPGATEAIVPEVRTEYEPDGKVSAVIDAGGAVTRFRYNQLGQLVEKVLPSPDAPTQPGAKTSYVHTRTGELLTTTDPSGAITKQVYDDLKRPIAATQIERKPRAAVFTSTFSYDDAGRVLKSTNPAGDVSEQVYDKLGQRIRSIDPDGAKTEFGYDGAGREVRTVDGMGRITDRVYNQVGWLTGTLNLAPDGSFIRGEQLKHDAVGNVVEEIDALGRSTKFTYDAADRLVKQVEPVSATDSITTTFGYSVADQRTRTTDGRGNSTITTYNALGLPEKVIEPATTAHPNEADRTWTTTYDKRGLATKVQVPGGITRERTYDALGRLRTESGSGAAHATQTRTRDYDERGLVVGVNARNTKNVYTYNDRGQLLTATGPSGNSSFGYDAAGRLTTKTDAAGTNTFTYLKGRLSSIQDGVTNALQSLAYNAAGDLDRITYGPDAIRKYEYDDLGREKADKIETSTGATIGSITYGYDLNDQLTSKVTTGTAGASTNTYGYDHAGRMTSWTSNGVTTDYGWDKSGNRVRAGDKVSTFDQRNRLESDGDYTYTYSARGTLEGRTSSGLTDTYGWDAFDQAVLRGSTTFTYDGLGRMIGRNGGTFAYAGFGIDPVSDGESLFSRGIDDSLLAVGTGDQKKLTVSDRHGDVVGTLRPGGSSIEDSVAYDPFGKRVAGTGLKVGYQGDWTDPESGEVNMGARWYSPSTGSFTSRDSIVLPSSPSIAMNRYTYGAGSPMNYDDPDGHFFGWIKEKAKQVGNAISDGAKAAWNWAKTDGLEFVKEVSGYNDIKGCLTNPSWGGCAMAALNFIPAGKVVNLAAKGIKAGVKAVKATKIGRAAENIGGGLKSAGGIMRAAGKVITEVKWVKIGGKLVKQTVSRVVKGAAKYGAGAARAVARSAGDIIRAMPGHAFAKMAAEQAAKRIPPSTFAALRKPMVAAKDLVVTSPFSPASIVSHALDNVVDGGAVLDFFRTMVLKNTDDVIKEAPAAARMGSEVAQGAGAKLDDVARPGRSGGSRSDDLADGAAGAACSLASRLGVTNSFAPGTLVLMADGSRKKIEDVRAGDRVLAKDPTTGKFGAREVTEVRSKVSERTMVELTDSSGGKIQATDEHPFWVESEKRWVKAADLRPSYRFLTADNRSAEVTGTRSWSGVQQVHNFTVDGLHTYFVASSREAAPLLVHNEGSTPPIESMGDGCELRDPFSIRFTQKTAGWNYSNGGNINDFVQAIRSGNVDWSRFEPVRLVQRPSGLFSLDNRRLVAFQMADAAIPAVMAPDNDETDDVWRKHYNTQTDGVGISIRKNRKDKVGKWWPGVRGVSPDWDITQGP